MDADDGEACADDAESATVSLVEAEGTKEDIRGDVDSK